MSESSLQGTMSMRRLPLILSAGLLFARLASLLAMTVDGLYGYGDMLTFHSVYSLPGWPFLDYWVEYPPLVPFLNAVLIRLAGGQEHTFAYLLVFLLLLADAASVFLFGRLAGRLFPAEGALARSGAYLLVLVSLAYGWWNVDSFAVFWMLLGLCLLFEGNRAKAGLAVGLGAATKLFPILALLAAWKRTGWRRLAFLAAMSVAPLALLYGTLWQASPEFTTASIRSQGSKGSWETVWALVDGNMRTGSFGPVADRLDPARAGLPVGNPPVIPPLASLAVFVLIGLFGLLKARPQDDRQSLAVVGFAFCLLMLWSPGWSPQWVLYLIPLILLVIPLRQALLIGLVLVLVNLLEWPLLLSRGLFDTLWLTILLRTGVLIILTIAFYVEMRGKEPSDAAA